MVSGVSMKSGIPLTKTLNLNTGDAATNWNYSRMRRGTML